MSLLTKLDPEVKRGLVNTVADTLQTRPDWWQPAGESPTENAAAVLDHGEACYSLAYWNGTGWQAWKNAPTDADVTIAKPVKRWAVIPG
jgi:hypothetical protein